MASELCAAAGLIGLAFLPDLLPSPLAGIIISVMIYAVGSGLIEVLGSPIVEACPFDHKEAAMRSDPQKMSKKYPRPAGLDKTQWI